MPIRDLSDTSTQRKPSAKAAARAVAQSDLLVVFGFRGLEAHFLCEALEAVEDTVDAGVVRVERAAMEVHHLGVSLMVRIGAGHEELRIAGGTPHILGRTGADGTDKARVVGAGMASPIFSTLITWCQLSPKS